MNRIALTNANGAWFNEATAESYEEGTYHDGRNHISKATGSQWDHERLYKTASGKFILHAWSAYQGQPATWVEITEKDAAQWFSKNGLAPDALCETEFANLELK